MNGQTSPSFCQEINFHDIQRLLILLGIGMQYMGFKLCSQAIFLAIQEPDRLLATSKWLYPDVAKRCGVTLLSKSSVSLLPSLNCTVPRVQWLSWG